MRAERVGDSCSAVRAERGVGLDDGSAGVAVGCGYRWCRDLATGGKNLASDEGSLRRVVLLDAAGHEEGLDEAEDKGDACPGEEEIKDA